jgi:uncharacterized protein (TIGR03663 family)
MLAFHFTNKENSYLHAAVWSLGIFLIVFLSKKVFWPEDMPAKNPDRFPIVLNSLSIFIAIFVLLYTSFFQHPNGWLTGVKDGLYAKSLLYWWEQDQKRRIDGPFDYHLPILANYEFLLVPFVVLAWYRMLAFSKAVAANGRRFFLADRSKLVAGFCTTLVLLAFLAPRLALVPEACTISEFCLETLSKPASTFITPFAKHMHIGHSRHLLQIFVYLFAGGAAFFYALHNRHRADAFAWFWLTASLGIYSYVGEKVPWLTVYIVLPMILIAGLECARLLSGDDLPFAKLQPEFSQVSDGITKKICDGCNRLVGVCGSVHQLQGDSHVLHSPGESKGTFGVHTVNARGEGCP